MKKTVITICVLIISLSLFAQQDTTIKIRKNEIGFHAGFTTGLGFSYRLWLGKNGVQLTGIPIKINDDFFLSGAVTFMHKFYESKYVRFFCYLGNHFIYSNNKVESFTPYSSGNEYRTEEKVSYNIGIGPGFGFGSVVKFNVMFGYGAYNLLNNKDYSLLPTGEMGLYYCF